jgi:bisphosphoglycerate-independent phosphoglycerate mutase (AlkP superfamily)
VKSPSIMDIAPTVLRLFGLAVPAHMDGRVLIDGPVSSSPEKVKKR